MTRADRNNNPTAFTTDLARQAGLVRGVDYVDGDPFPVPSNLFTAKLLGDPIALTCRLIDNLTYYTKNGAQRWNYIAIPPEIWRELNETQRLRVIYFHYSREGGSELESLFNGLRDGIG